MPGQAWHVVLVQLGLMWTPFRNTYENTVPKCYPFVGAETCKDALMPRAHGCAGAVLPDAIGCIPWLFATRSVAPTLVLRINMLPAYVHTRKLKEGCYVGAPLHVANIRDPEGRSYPGPENQYVTCLCSYPGTERRMPCRSAVIRREHSRPGGSLLHESGLSLHA